MILRIDGASPVPPYEQLRQQVTTMVVSGELADGTRLPPIRQLARDLGLAAGTIARAYRELESDGVVASYGRRGTFTRAPRRAPAPADRSALLAEAARTYAVRARQLGADPEEALGQLDRAFEELVPGGTGEPRAGSK